MNTTPAKWRITIARFGALKVTAPGKLPYFVFPAERHCNCSGFRITRDVRGVGNCKHLKMALAYVAALRLPVSPASPAINPVIAICRACGVQQYGERRELVRRGWALPGHEAICPRHAEGE